MHFFQLVQDLWMVHTDARMLHRDIRPENLVVFYDPVMKERRIVLIDWGFSVNLEGGPHSYFFGAYSGTRKTASQSILQQRSAQENLSSPILSRPADDFESLVKSDLLIVDRYMGNDLVTDSDQEIYRFWESHGAFTNIRNSLNGGNFSDIWILQKYFKRPNYNKD